MFKKILNKDKTFFEIFEQASANLCKGARALQELVEHYPESIGENLDKIRDIEHEGDQMTHKTIDMVNRTFVTPIDREDIHHLISKLDDVLDFIYAAANRLVLYKIPAVTEETKGFSDLLVKATELLHEAISNFRNSKKSNETLKYCIDIHTIENQGDELKCKAMVNLFTNEENHPINAIKWREIYEKLERSVDCCEDVANVIEGIIVKNV